MYEGPADALAAIRHPQVAGKGVVDLTGCLGGPHPGGGTGNGVMQSARSAERQPLGRATPTWLPVRAAHLQQVRYGRQAQREKTGSQGIPRPPPRPSRPGGKPTSRRGETSCTDAAAVCEQGSDLPPQPNTAHGLACLVAWPAHVHARTRTHLCAHLTPAATRRPASSIAAVAASSSCLLVLGWPAPGSTSRTVSSRPTATLSAGVPSVVYACIWGGGHPCQCQCP